MMAGAVSSLPEQGQLVSVRSRRWVVGEVNKSTLPPSPLEPVPAQPQHLVSLLSVEDDALGEELQVVWEIEPGAEVIEKVALPEQTGFDAPDRLDAFCEAVRWGAASSGIMEPDHVAHSINVDRWAAGTDKGPEAVLSGDGYGWSNHQAQGCTSEGRSTGLLVPDHQGRGA